LIRIGSLFSGIGGLELGLERGLSRSGFRSRVVWQVEREPYARRVLAKQWPEATRYEDVSTLDFSTVGAVDLICGGFPCQDLSLAGRGAGIEGDRSGLWRHLAGAVREVRPGIVVLENVPPILIRGVGAVFGEMASIGYDLWWDCIPAQSIGAPHRRDRWFAVAVIADSASVRRNRYSTIAGGMGTAVAPAQRRPSAESPRGGHNPDGGTGETMADAGNFGLQGEQPTGTTERATLRGNGARISGETQSGMGGNAYGISGRMDGSHRFPAGRGVAQRGFEPPRVRERRPEDRARLRALGNAVVPQVAEVIGQIAGEFLLRGFPPAPRSGLDFSPKNARSE